MKRKIIVGKKRKDKRRVKTSIQEESANKFMMGKKAADERREKNENNEAEDVNCLTMRRRKWRKRKRLRRISRKKED